MLRRRAKKAQIAATRLQQAWRRHLVRLDAAVLIQRHARGHVTRLKLVRERTLGAWLRMFVLRRRFWRARDASTKIQGRWRQWHVFLAETEAAIAVQSVYRSHLCRRRVQKSQAAATAIQLVWRRRQQTAMNAATSEAPLLAVDAYSQGELEICKMDAPTLETTDPVEPDVEFGSDGDMALPPADDADDAQDAPEVAALSLHEPDAISTQESSSAVPSSEPEASNTLPLVADGTEMGAQAEQDPVEAAFTTHDEDVFGADGDMALPPDDEAVENVGTSKASIENIDNTFAAAAETPTLSSWTSSAHLGSVQESSCSIDVTASDLQDAIMDSTDGSCAVKNGEIEAAEADAATSEGEGDSKNAEGNSEKGNDEEKESDEEEDEDEDEDDDGEEDEEEEDEEEEDEEEEDEKEEGDDEEGDDEEGDEETDDDEEVGDDEEDDEKGAASGSKDEDSSHDTDAAKLLASADDDTLPHEASATPPEAMVAVQSGTRASTVERSGVAGSSVAERELSTCTTDDASLHNKLTSEATSIDEALIQATSMAPESDEHEGGAASIGEAAADALCIAVERLTGSEDAAPGADVPEHVTPATDDAVPLAAPHNDTIDTLETAPPTASPVDHSSAVVVPDATTTDEPHSVDASLMTSEEIPPGVNEAEYLSPATSGARDAEVFMEPYKEATSVDEAPEMMASMAIEGNDYKGTSDEAPANALCAAPEPPEDSDDVAASMDEPEYVLPTMDDTMPLTEPRDEPSDSLEKAASSASPVDRSDETIMDELHLVDASPVASDAIPSLANDAEKITPAADSAREAEAFTEPYKDTTSFDDNPVDTEPATPEGDDHGVLSAPSSEARVNALCTALEPSTASADLVLRVGESESSISGNEDAREPVAKTEPHVGAIDDEPAIVASGTTKDDHILVSVAYNEPAADELLTADASPMASARSNASSSALVLDADELLHTVTLVPDPVAAGIEVPNECESNEEELVTSTTSDPFAMQSIEGDAEQATAQRLTEPVTDVTSVAQSFSNMTEAEASADAPGGTSRIDSVSEEEPPSSEATLELCTEAKPLPLPSNDPDNDEPSTSGIEIDNAPIPDAECPQSVAELTSQDLTGPKLTAMEPTSDATRISTKEDDAAADKNDTNVFNTPIPSQGPGSAKPTAGAVVASPSEAPMVESTDSVPTNVELDQDE